MKKYLRIMLPTALVAAAVCFVPVTRAAEETKAKSMLSAGDKTFVKKAYKGGLTEVANAKMAQEKAKDEATKKIAEQMVTDHSKANDELMKIAEEEKLDLSKAAAKPMTISGDNFDKKYLMMLQEEHQKDIAMFEKEAADAKPGEDRDVPTFAKKTLPTLKEHLTMINEAIAKMK